MAFSNRARPWLAPVFCVAACHKTAPPTTSANAGSAAVGSQANGSAAPTGATCAAAKAEHGSRLAWFVDDYPAALACAVATQRAIVMDLWAPWCHTCLSMQNTVFTDAAMAAIADKFVFVAIDTDRDRNAATVAAFPLSAWPTFYVIAPSEQVLGRLVGSASASQFVAFVQDSQVTATPQSVAALITQGDQAVTRGDFTAAEPLFAAALEKAGQASLRRPQIVLSLLQTKAKRNDFLGCVRLASTEAGNLGQTSAASDAMHIAMNCAQPVSKQNEAGAAAAAQLRTVAITTWTTLLAAPNTQLSVDDRADAMVGLREAYDAMDKHSDAVAMAETQRALLDDAAGKARTPLAASTYNWPRAEVYVYLGRALDIVPALVASANALPTDYDPPYRAAWAYFQGQKYTDAALWANKAKALVYGPRKTRVLALLIDIAKAQRDHGAELEARRELVTTYQALPSSAQNPNALAAAQAELAAAEDHR
ncbi:MAG: thioredoxin family protein [Kofleriaceae bacterium]|nr:thioredoxin family protein [Kofleriaceae bacterium]